VTKVIGIPEELLARASAVHEKLNNNELTDLIHKNEDVLSMVVH